MSQKSFFELEPQESENPFRDWSESVSHVLAQVVFPSGLDGKFDYLIPQEIEGKLFPGVRIMVPLGKSNRPTLGYCVGEEVKTLTSKESARLKSIQSVIDSNRLLSDKMLNLAEWISDYYLCPLGTVLEAMLPAGVRGHAATRLTSVLYVAENADEKIEKLKKIASNSQTANSFSKKIGIENKSTEAAQNRNVNIGTSRQKTELVTDKQIYVLNVLKNSPEPLTANELTKAAKCSLAPVQALKRLGLIRTKTIRRETVPRVETATKINPADLIGHKLNSQQQNALDTVLESIEKMEHRTFLLHGVTGSGKTEVYIQAIETVVKYGRQAIVLVPEISLTPQTVGRFKGRFEHVAVLHSHLTDAERNRQWNKIVSGEIQVVVGARSAVFAPTPNLGLIIIDEEHESSFKQDTAPRYNARNVAKKRAENESVPLILGSATPSLESWVAAQKGDFQLISMPSRVAGRKLPAVNIVDLREAVRSRNTRGAVHQQLHSAIDSALKSGGQVILLLNRRGFSTQIQCPACGNVVKCPECDVSLTHHRSEEIALCHYCDYQIPAPQKCPSCGFLGIRYSGFGTQKLEMEIKNRFPDATVLRMDTDTMQGHGAHERALSQFREGKVQILLGTQMIAKGLDFPNVTLVGVINSDTALHLPDFRASERTFLLITQVAGRTGRGEKEGRVIVQTFCPDHAAIVSATAHDYLGFVSQELPLREALGYPPYSKMARIVVRGPNEEKTLAFARDFADRFRKELENGHFYLAEKAEEAEKVEKFEKPDKTANNENKVESQSNQPLAPKFRLLGPAPAPFAKLRNVYRFHLHVHVYDADFLRWAFKRASSGLKTPDEIQWMIDIDPMDML
ncbi:MAG: replication restart helicase PriA [Thermoguttaceae bacterium]